MALFKPKAQSLRKLFKNDSVVFNWAGGDSSSLTKNPAVAACTRIISAAIASIPLDVLDVGGGRAFSHPLYRVLHDRPNYNMTSSSFVEAIVNQLLTPGNVYLLQVSEGWVPLNPSKMEVKFEGPKKVFIFDGKRQKDGTIVHIPGHSRDGIMGIDLVEENKKTIELNNLVRKFGAKYFRNSASPSMAVVQKELDLSGDQMAQLKANFSSAHTNVDNAGGIPFIPYGFELVSIPLNAKDALLLDALRFGILDIARIFSIPPHMLADLEKSSFSSLYAQDQQFLKYTLMPWIDKIETGLNAGLLQSADFGKIKIKFNVSAFARGTLDERYGAYNTALQAGFMTVNEIRRLEDLPPISGGDVLRVPLNMAPIEQANGPAGGAQK